MRILIAEDDTMSRLLLAAALQKMGHEVVTTTNGREAWNAFQAEAFRLLISDWIMPEMDGLELCRMVRARKQAEYTFIILLTVLGGKDYFLKGMQAGADDFIVKPFDEDQLAARVNVAERIVGLHREIKQLKNLLPICSYCKRIRNDKNYWETLEAYFRDQTNIELSHGICPSCFEQIVQSELKVLGTVVPDEH